MGNNMVLNFDYDEFKKILKNEKVKEIWLNQGQKVFVDMNVRNECLNEYNELDENTCIDIVNNLKKQFDIGPESDNGVYIAKANGNEKVLITDRRTNLNGYCITYRRV